MMMKWHLLLVGAAFVTLTACVGNGGADTSMADPLAFDAVSPAGDPPADPPAEQVPEPGSAVLAATGLLAIGGLEGIRRRRRR
ncbi:MAG TPA: hypothetical protein VJT32_06580 [bacterium]|nr:hypothetical protein [bacterium]